MKFAFSHVALAASALALAATANAQVLINEFNSTDSDEEFIELFNTTGSSIDLSAEGYVLVFLNGSNDEIYQSEALTGTLPANGYYTIKDSQGGGTVDGVAVDQVGGFSSFQNGQDGMALVRSTTTGDFGSSGDYSTKLAADADAVQVDALIYGGADSGLEAEFGLASGVNAADNTADGTSAQRTPDGQGGTSWTSTDWAIEPSTVGSANAVPPVDPTFGDVFTSTSTTIVTSFVVAPGSGGETTPANWSVNDSSGATATGVSGSNPYTITFSPALSGDLTVDTLTFDNGSDLAATGDLVAGILDLAAYRAAAVAAPDTLVSFGSSLVTVSGEIIEDTLDDNDNATMDGLALEGANALEGGGVNFTGPGDEVTVVGLLGNAFGGLAELDFDTAGAGIISTSGDTVLDATPVALGDITGLTTPTLELNESKLVTITNVEFVDAGNAVPSGSNNFTLVGTDFVVRVDSTIASEFTGSPLQPGGANGLLPSGSGSLTGVISQFDNTGPVDAGYQLLPLTAADFDFPVIVGISIVSAVAVNGDIVVNFTGDPGVLSSANTDITINGGMATIDSVSGTGNSRTFEISPDPTPDATLDNVNVAAGVNENLDFYAYPTIAAIQTGLVSDGLVSVIGSVYAEQDTGGRFAMADAIGANNGIIIDNNAPAPITVGNEVEVVGLLAGADFKEIDLDNVSDLTDRGAGIAITPTIVAAADFQSTSTTNTAPADQWEGVLITVQGLTGPSDGGFGERQFDQNVRTDDFFLSTAEDQIDLGDVPGAVYDITGIGNFSFSTYKILPRSNADIDVTPPASVSDWSLLED